MTRQMGQKVYINMKPANRDQYGWEANPWVWVIEFERIERKAGAE